MNLPPLNLDQRFTESRLGLEVASMNTNFNSANEGALMDFNFSFNSPITNEVDSVAVWDFSSRDMTLEVLSNRVSVLEESVHALQRRESSKNATNEGESMAVTTSSLGPLFWGHDLGRPVQSRVVAGRSRITGRRGAVGMAQTLFARMRGLASLRTQSSLRNRSSLQNRTDPDAVSLVSWPNVGRRSLVGAGISAVGASAKRNVMVATFSFQLKPGRDA
ncbi:hypothetical protein C8R46DRAFT_1037842 [Mycena filopes]|nr:hypothetical protein C8R46DRAFT_1037842 [Mycena filopes]